jgi:hypothetical protein
MHFLRRGAAMAVGLALAMAAGGGAGEQALAAAARAPVAAPLTEAEAMAALKVWLQRVVAWSQPYVALEADLVNGITALESDIGRAMKDRANPATGKVWAEEWAPAQHARLQEFRARANALRGGRLPEVPADLRRYPQARTLTANMARLPDAIAGLIDEMAGSLDVLIDTVAQTAGGDPAALKRLPGEALGLDITLAKAALNTPDPSAGMPDSPLSDLYDATQATWRADIVIEQAAKDKLAGKPVDRAAVAAALRAEAVNTETAVKAAVRHAAMLRRSIMTMPEGRLKQGFLRAIDSIGDTVKVYGELIAVWRSMASLVEDPDSDALSWIDAAQSIQGPMQTIAEQSLERRRLLSGAL